MDYLSFKIDRERRDEENMPLYMQVSRDNLVLRLSEHYGDGSPGANLCVEMTGVEDFPSGDRGQELPLLPSRH